MMRSIFLGKPIHWLILAVVFGVLWWMGDGLLQTRNFTLFIFVLLALSIGAVIAIRLTYRDGERITRDPFDETESE